MSGTWIQTYTNARFDLADPKPEDIFTEDIARALSHLCRFVGHTGSFYSVAEHCVLMSRAVEPRLAFEALLHDAAEAYVGDVTSPMKIAMRNLTVESYKHVSPFDVIEQRVREAISHRYGIAAVLPPGVKAADLAILETERRHFFADIVHHWNLDTEPLDVKIQCWEPDEAMMLYVERFDELATGRRAS